MCANVCVAVARNEGECIWKLREIFWVPDLSDMSHCLAAAV